MTSLIEESGLVPRHRFVSCLIAALAFCGCVFLAACGGSSSTARSASGTPVQTNTSSAEPLESYEASYPIFNDDSSEVFGDVSIDTSQVASGVVGVKAVNDKRLKFQVVTSSMTYTYDLQGDGSAAFFPLQSGNTTYSFHVMRNTSDDKYVELCSTTADVSLVNQFEPFLLPNQIVSYSASSLCVAHATQLRSQASTKIELASLIYSYITSTVAYDHEKAASVQSGYIPLPDETFTTKKGICFDYASLAAAMLRSQGIPAKVITGYVYPDDLYHAWNVIYFEETGWMTLEIQVEGNSWKLVDTTFAAEEGDTATNERTYTDRYVY